MLKVGLDIHGVIDFYPECFARLGRMLIARGDEIHIVTGQEWDKAKVTVKKHRIPYTHHFSIVDYHLSIGTKMHKDEKDTWWMEDTIWIRSKGDYIHREKIDMHFDDGYRYAEYCPDFCTFILVPKINFTSFYELLVNGINT